MRTTVTLADDVAAEVDRIRRHDGVGVSEAVNTLARRGMSAAADRPEFVQRGTAIGVKVDIANVSEVLELLDELDTASP